MGAPILHTLAHPAHSLRPLLAVVTWVCTFEETPCLKFVIAFSVVRWRNAASFLWKSVVSTLERVKSCDQVNIKSSVTELWKAAGMNDRWQCPERSDFHHKSKRERKCKEKRSAACFLRLVVKILLSTPQGALFVRQLQSEFFLRSTVGQQLTPSVAQCV